MHKFLNNGYRISFVPMYINFIHTTKHDTRVHELESIAVHMLHCTQV